MSAVSLQTTQSGYVKPHRRTTPGIGDGLYQFRVLPAVQALSPCDAHPDRTAQFYDPATGVARCQACWRAWEGLS